MLRSAGESLASVGEFVCANAASTAMGSSRRAVPLFMVFLVCWKGGRRGDGRPRVHYWIGQMPSGCPLQPGCPGPAWWLSRLLFAGSTYGNVVAKPSFLVLTPSPRAV